MPDVQRRRSRAAAGEASTARVHRAHGSSGTFCTCAGESSAAAFPCRLVSHLPCDAQKLSDSGSGDALMRDVHLVEAARDCLLPISSARAPARSHGVSLWLWCSFSLRSATSPELQVHEPWADLVSSGDGEPKDVSLLLWQRSNARRKLASVTCAEAPASDCLAEAARWLCWRNGHVSDDCSGGTF